MRVMVLLYSLFYLFPALAGTYEVAFQRGKVEILREGKLVAPPVHHGDQVKVSKGGLAILKGQGEVIKVMSDTVIRPTETKEGTLVDLVKGSVVSLITKKSYQVKTKSTAFGVRGTQFFVSSNGGDESWMCVQEGEVMASKDKKTVGVPAGKGVFVGKDGISKPESYAWTKGINWKMDPKEGKLDHKLNMKYDLLENFYD